MAVGVGRQCRATLSALGQPFMACCCCRRAQAPKRRTTTSRSLPASSSESEPEENPCRAELVAYLGVSGTEILAPAGCSDMASGPPVPILHEDAKLSDVRSLGSTDGVFCVPLCGHHCHRYRASLLGRQCAYSTCQHAGISHRNGLYLCVAHLRTNEVAWNDEPDRHVQHLATGEAPQGSGESSRGGDQRVCAPAGVATFSAPTATRPME
eukprot:13311980-Heterocapsa_arctica.AAC.1